MSKSLNTVIGIKKREEGQIPKVFEDSFDTKECYSEEFILQKLQYTYLNPVSKKWNSLSAVKSRGQAAKGPCGR